MRADCTRLITAAARWPARGLPANSQLFLPIAIGRIWFSIQLLFTGSCPSSTKRVSALQQSSALAVAELSGSFCRCSRAAWRRHPARLQAMYPWFYEAAPGCISPTHHRCLAAALNVTCVCSTRYRDGLEILHKNSYKHYKIIYKNHLNRFDRFWWFGARCLHSGVHCERNKR